MTKVYVAGSIRGDRGPSQKEFIAAIIAAVQEAGLDCVNWRVWAQIFAGQQPELSDQEIFKRDMEMIQLAEILIADITYPSLGVGWEINEAAMLDYPLLCVWDANVTSKPSAMIVGNPMIDHTGVSSIDELKVCVSKWLAMTLEELDIHDDGADWDDLMDLDDGYTSSPPTYDY